MKRRILARFNRCAVLIVLSATYCVRVRAQETDTAGDQNAHSIGTLLDVPATADHTPMATSAGKDSWDLAGGYTFVRFNSKQFRASTSGVNISARYSVTKHVEIEGQITITMADPKPGPYDLKYFFCGGGAIFTKGSGRTRPFIRGLVGIVHVLPQTAYSNHAFAAVAGVGTDIGVTNDLGIRIGADYLRSQLYHSAQNNVAYFAELHYRF